MTAKLEPDGERSLRAWLVDHIVRAALAAKRVRAAWLGDEEGR